MNRVYNIFSVLIFALLFLSGTAIALESLDPDNLVSRDFFYPAMPGYPAKLTWWPKSDRKFMEITDGVFKLSSPGKKVSGEMRIRIYDEVADKFRISFDYILTGNGTVSGFHSQPVTLRIPRADKWTSFNGTLKRFEKIRFSVSGGGFLKLKNLKVVPVPPAADMVKRKRILTGNTELTGIIIKKTTPAQSFYDRRAAKILRKYLYEAGGKLLPIEYYADSKNPVGKIFCGKAAEESKIISGQDMGKVKPGGYFLNVSDGNIAVAGAEPSGIVSGAFALLNEFGLLFLTETEIDYPQSRDLVVKACVKTESPFFEYRINDYPNCMALGYTDPNYRSNGEYLGANRFLAHMSSYLINYDKNCNTHPEYFALQKNGKRHNITDKGHAGHLVDIYLCRSNPEVAKIVADNLINWMKANPAAKYFPLCQGDHNDMFCRCDKCRSLGSVTDQQLIWTNKIAGKVKKVFPEKVIWSIAYVDSAKPPQRVKYLEPNILIINCIYDHHYWGNLFELFHPANKLGLKYMQEWFHRFRKNMGLGVYFISYPKPPYVFPAFYGSYETIMYAVKAGVNKISFHGVFNGRNTFLNPMQRYVFGKLAWNPKLDIEKEIDKFLRLYYGPAAPYIREFFDLAHKEVKDRDLYQQTGDPSPVGVMSKKLTDKSCELFVKAEKAVAGNEKYLNRVLRQKMIMLFSAIYDRNLGNGAISKEQIPEFALRLVEFLKLAEKYHSSNWVQSVSPEKWLKLVAMIDVKKPWTKDKFIEKFKQNPTEVLLKSFENRQKQKAIANGWEILIENSVGGEFRNTKPCYRAMRRASSIFGTLKAELELPELPANGLTLELSAKANTPELCTIKLKVNGKELYSGGAAPLVPHKWTVRKFNIGAGLLKKGTNIIEVCNTTPDNPGTLKHGFNYYWGWFAVQKMVFLKK